MEAVSTPRLDPTEVDRRFVLSLFHGLCNSVPDDMRKKLVKEDTDVLQFVMAVRPRLTPFSHRQIFSLRHPATSMLSRRYFSALRAFLEENPICGAHPKPSRSSPSGFSCETGDRGIRSPAALPASLNPRLIKAKHLRGYDWDTLGLCHKILLGESPFSTPALEGVVSDEMLVDIIRRYWDRLTCPNNGAGFGASFEVSVSSYLRPTSSQSSDALHRATHMTPTQYTYLHMRFVQILLPPGALEAEVFDNIISDLRIDGKYPPKWAGVSLPAASGGSFIQDAVDILLNSESYITRQTLPNLSDNVATDGETSSMKSPPALARAAAPLLALPDLSFAQFFYSMIEFADNWTSTAHPKEYVAFLTELYCEVFGHDWDDEDPALRKALHPTERAAVPVRVGRWTDDGYDDEDDDPSARLLAEYANVLLSLKPTKRTSSRGTDEDTDYRDGFRDTLATRPKTGAEAAAAEAGPMGDAARVHGSSTKRLRDFDGSYVGSDSVTSALEGVYDVGGADDMQTGTSQRDRLLWRPQGRGRSVSSKCGSLNSQPGSYDIGADAGSRPQSSSPETAAGRQKITGVDTAGDIGKRSSMKRVVGSDGFADRLADSDESRGSFENSIEGWGGPQAGSDGFEVDEGETISPSRKGTTPGSGRRRFRRKRTSVGSSGIKSREGSAKSKSKRDSRPLSGAGGTAHTDGTSHRAPHADGARRSFRRGEEVGDFRGDDMHSESSAVADALNNAEDDGGLAGKVAARRRPSRSCGSAGARLRPTGSAHSTADEWDEEGNDDGRLAIHNKGSTRLPSLLRRRGHSDGPPRLSSNDATDNEEGGRTSDSGSYGYNAKMLQGRGKWLRNTEMKCDWGPTGSSLAAESLSLQFFDDPSGGYNADDEAINTLLLAQRRIEQKWRSIELEQQQLLRCHERKGNRVDRMREGSARGAGKFIKFRFSSVERHRLTTEEVNEYRDVIIKRLLAKGVKIPPESLADDDVLNLMEDNLQPELVQRLMRLTEGYSEDLACSDLLDALLSDDAKVYTTSSALEASVLGALCRKAHQRPVETAYMRYVREKRERELQQEVEAAREQYRASRVAVRELLMRAGMTPTMSTAPFSELQSTPPRAPPFLPALPPLTSPRTRPLERLRRQGTSAFFHELDDFDTVVPMRSQPPSRALPRIVPRRPLVARRLPRPHRARLALAGFHLPTQRYANEYYREESAHGVRVRIHSQRRLNIFYREIRVDRPILGRAPLAPLTSIFGGTYHQLAALRVRCGRRRRLHSRMLRYHANQEGVLPLPRYLPVKLFSLTTKTTLAGALKESLMCYINDKAYLDMLHGDVQR